MNHNNIKLLMDHSLGESQNYHRPSEQELLDDYLHAVESLTFNEENRLKMKVKMLESEKTNYEKLDAKLDALARDFYRNNVSLGDPLPEEGGNGKHLTEEERENNIRRSKMIRNHRRRCEWQLLQEIEQQN